MGTFFLDALDLLLATDYVDVLDDDALAEAIVAQATYLAGIASE